VFDAIEATDWTAVPGFAKSCEPAVTAPALRKLAAATTPAPAVEAAAPYPERMRLTAHLAMTLIRGPRQAVQPPWW
jgi:hypothetical protein